MTDNLHDEPTKVRMALATPVTGGGTSLKLVTTHGVELTFLLDDGALALMALTANSAAHAAYSRAGDNPDRAFLFPKEESSL